ncbi:hypothetical protein [Neorhodopirellula pilleata]|uniref:Uncharacterized protein n=1 Tax=Neorhodopirellula pilleata TaxID=2714738 RepID=A0A5C5ZPX2_9BACT|nr:hypothetical protein [Neorhodopirellula pilleata]TWT89185.1 hypothetical protein Pla100_56520 [Neorhodopirellula pilleata]
MCPAIPESIKRLCLLSSVVISLIALSAENVSAQQQPSALSKVAQKINPVNWKMPSLRLPNFLVPNTEQDRIVQRKNGLVQDVKETSAKSWQRTKQIFNPARLNPMNLLAGPNGADTTPKDPDKPGFFSSLLSPGPAEPTERVATVNEFLGQERPK